MATDIGIDLGSSKTVIFSSSKVVLELPNVVTVDSETWEPVYFGEKAKQTIGRTPDSLECVFPIEHGVISIENITNEFQGALRYGQLNTDGLIERINNDSKIFYKDFNNVKTSVGITHMNEFELDISKLKTNGTIYTSYSPFITEKKIGVEKI